MSDLERVVGEAQKARDEAEAAANRANELEAQANQAREKAEQEEIERRKQWAQHLIDTYDADLAEADKAIQLAQERFDTAAVQDISQAISAYVAWGEASLRHYGLQIRVSAAASILDYESSAPEFVTPPLFSEALDAALARSLSERGEAARQEVQTELARLVDGDEQSSSRQTAQHESAQDPGM